jgi:hypothetical protein
MTLEELIAQCKSENPVMICTINDEKITLNAEEYEKAAHDWAVMRLAQIEFEQKAEQSTPIVAVDGN